MNSNNRIAATLYSLRTEFVSGILVQTPCIKEMMVMMTMIIIIACNMITNLTTSISPWKWKVQGRINDMITARGGICWIWNGISLVGSVPMFRSLVYIGGLRITFYLKLIVTVWVSPMFRCYRIINFVLESSCRKAYENPQCVSFIL